jgi:hypothetical protein
VKKIFILPDHTNGLIHNRYDPLKRDQPVATAFTCTTHDIHKRQIFMTPAGLELAIPETERPPG